MTAAHDLQQSHRYLDTQVGDAPLHLLRTDHVHRDTQGEAVGADFLPPARADSTPRPSTPGETSLLNGAKNEPPPIYSAPRSADPYMLLAILADAVDDLERVKTATDNRVRSLQQVKGLTGTPEEMQMLALADSISASEAMAVKELVRAMKDHPLGPWVKSMKGVGEKQAARLLAAIGDPYWHPVHERPRRVSELIALCGYHVVDGESPRHRKGVKSNWNNVARSRLFVIVESCMKSGIRTVDGEKVGITPYGELYLAARAKYADAVHEHQCQNHKKPPARSNGCGTQANPEWGAPGSPLRDGHVDMRARRIVAKQILKDMWKEAQP